MAKKKGVLTKLFGPQSMARQFFVWNVVAEFIRPLLTPLVNILETQAHSLVQTVPHSPGVLADLVARGIVGQEWAIREAKKTGISPENFNLLILAATAFHSPATLADMVLRGIVGQDFATREARRSALGPENFNLLVQAAGQPPALGDMLMLMRQGKVDRADVVRAIRQSQVRNEWTDTILKMGIQPPTPTDILEAYLEGQVDETRARQLYQALGGDPEYFTLLYNTRGQAPTPLQAADMAARGVIPWEGKGPDAVSFEQAFLEGPWRNKWMPAFRKSADYIPEPRTITAMMNEGSITREKAIQLLRAQHVPPDLMDAFLFDGSATKTKEARTLTISIISQLYQEQAIDDDDARGMLQALRYEEDEANFILLSWQLSRELKYRNAAIGTVRTQFINHKIDHADASLLLDKFLVPAKQRDALLALWQFEESAKVATLTATQIRTAWKREIIDTADAMQRLTNQGYTVDDAAIFLQIS